VTGSATPTTLHAKDWTGLVVTAERGSLALRASYSRMKVDTDIPAVQPLIDALDSIPTAFCVGCASVADSLHLKGTKYRNLALGAQYDDGTNVAIAEYAKRIDNGTAISPDMHGAHWRAL
jgi:hypothetical protein